MRRVRREPEGSQSICSLTRPQRRQSTRRTGSCNQTCRSNRSRSRTRRIRWSWINGVGCRHRRQQGKKSARGSRGKQGVMVGRKRLGDDGITWPEGGNINMMHGDSRVMVVVCLETASLPAPCLSTSTSQDPAKNLLFGTAIFVYGLFHWRNHITHSVSLMQKSPAQTATPRCRRIVKRAC